MLSWFLLLSPFWVRVASYMLVVKHVRGIIAFSWPFVLSCSAGRRWAMTDFRVSARALRRQMHGVFFDEALAGALREEAPAVYRPLSSVMRAQADLVRIERQVRPRLSYKGA